MNYKLFLEKPDYLSEWEFFVWRHKKKSNLVWHFFSLNLFLIPLFMFFVKFEFWPLYIFLILLSIPVGSAGHYFSKDGSVRSRDFAHPNTVWYLIIIYFLILMNRYKLAVESVSRKIEFHNDETLLGQ